jgi:hypothetical protein
MPPRPGRKDEVTISALAMEGIMRVPGIVPSGINARVNEQDELKRLRDQARGDRKLFERAALALAEIDRNTGLSNEQADVLAALRLRVEGRERASLEDLLSTAGDAGSRRRLEDALPGEDGPSSDWPTITEKKKDWPGLG